MSRKGSRAYSSAVPRVIFFPFLSPLDHLHTNTSFMTASSDTALQKRNLRGRLRSDRDALSATYRADCAKHALQHLLTWQPWTAATLIGSYLPHESEFDPTLLAQAAVAGHRRWLPPPRHLPASGEKTWTCHTLLGRQCQRLARAQPLPTAWGQIPIHEADSC